MTVGAITAPGSPWMGSTVISSRSLSAAAIIARINAIAVSGMSSAVGARFEFNVRHRGSSPLRWLLSL